MKAILTYILIFSFGVLALAQESKSEMETLTLGVEVKSETQLRKRFPKKRKVARIYLFKNSRVKKELAFKSKRHKTKLA